MAALREFYENLFAKDVLMGRIVKARQLLLEHIIDKLLEQDILSLGVSPNLDELWETLKRMPIDCASGPDRITLR